MSLESTDLANNDFTPASSYKFKYLDNLNISSIAKRKLILNLNRVVSGSSEVYLTPIGKDNDPDLVLKSLDFLIDSNKDKLSSNLLDLELGNRSKFGPRSIAKPWLDRKSSLYDYFKSHNDSQNKSLNFNLINKSNMRPLSVGTAASYLKGNTSSGLPFYDRKSSVIPEVISEFRSLLDRKDPCVLFTRTQEQGKTRNVWGYPIADTLNEMRFYQPILGYQRKLKWRSALQGPHAVDVNISQMFNSRSNDNVKFVSIDFSSYDASVGTNLQSASFNYLKLLFQSNYHSEIDDIAFRFNTIGIATPDGILAGNHGVPSGATFTNEVDSLSQYIIYMNSRAFRPDSYQIQGDDGAYCVESDKVDALYSAFDTAGLTVNEDKSSVSSDHLIYLQRLYDRQYSNNGFIGGIYSIYRAMNRIIYQERYSDFMDYSLKGSDYYSIRTITILENCKYHPLFKDFVKLVSGLDKYRLRFNVEALSKYDRMLNNSSGTTGFLNNQFGDNLKGLNNFETVKLLRELR